MDYPLNTQRKISFMPDTRTARRDTILQELRAPERLTTKQIEALVEELGELQASLQANPPEHKE